MLLIPHVLIGLLGLCEREDFLVDNWLDVVGLDGTVHFLELRSATNINTTDDADVDQCIKVGGLLLSLASTDEANDGDHAVESDSLDRLAERCWTANLDHMLHTTATSELLSSLAPVCVLLIVDDVVRAKFFELVRLGLRRCRSNDSGACSLGKLQENIRNSSLTHVVDWTYLNSKDRDTSSTLSQNIVTWHKALQAVQCVPCGHTSTSESCTFQEVQLAREMYKALFVVGTILLQGTIDNTTSTGRNGIGVHGAGQMALVENSNNLVAGLETVDL